MWAYVVGMLLEDLGLAAGTSGRDLVAQRRKSIESYRQGQFHVWQVQNTTKKYSPPILSAV